MLVYDLVRHKAVCLGKNISWIWKRCTGSRTARELARDLQKSIGQPVSEDIVRMALHRLGRARLLREPVEASIPGPVAARRDLLRRAALLGGFSLMSIVAPTPSLAASCVPKHGPCDPNGPNRCCPNCSCKPSMRCEGPC